MDSPPSQDPSPPSRFVARLLAPIWSFLAGPNFDAKLAEGIRPSSHASLERRARQITSERARRRLSRTLRLRADAAHEPHLPLSPKVPLDQAAVASCESEIRKLADLVASVERPRARGVAIARQLAYDGLSPLYWNPNGKSDDAAERLASTIRAAQAALEVSADLD